MGPELPIGNSSVFSTVAQSLAFHDSPEAFITSLSIAPNSSQTFDFTSPIPRKVVRARLLNRDVAIVSSYQVCKDILGMEESSLESEISTVADEEGNNPSPAIFSACLAYKELMSDFFPSPNLLIESYPAHIQHRKQWESSFAPILEDTTSQIRDISIDFFNGLTSDGEVDLYKSMKLLSWKILLGTMLDLHHTQADFAIVQSLQETLLAGQFSPFRVSIRTPLWKSPRTKGIDASKRLKDILASRLISADETANCPFRSYADLDSNDIASHSVLFTSSLAVKSLASLLTATMMNLFVQPQIPPLHTRFDYETQEHNSLLLKSIIVETERLSPPVVGVMRRAQSSVVISTSHDAPSFRIPAGWDVWLYLCHANRDDLIFPLADTFLPERYLTPDAVPLPMTFGYGSKTCLAQEFVRKIVLEVTGSILELGIAMKGDGMRLGVRSWLGWEAGVAAADYARDMKQLPVQRPKGALKVRFHLDAKKSSSFP